MVSKPVPYPGFFNRGVDCRGVPPFSLPFPRNPPFAYGPEQAKLYEHEHNYLNFVSSDNDIKQNNRNNGIADDTGNRRELVHLHGTYT